jgi:hypothetical protein
MPVGLTSDFTKNYLGFPRSYCLSLVAILFIASQILAASIQDITELWKASAMVGLAYGSVFGIFPTMVIEWFGLCALMFNLCRHLALSKPIFLEQHTFQRTGVTCVFRPCPVVTSSLSLSG